MGARNTKYCFDASANPRKTPEVFGYRSHSNGCDGNRARVSGSVQAMNQTRLFSGDSPRTKRTAKLEFDASPDRLRTARQPNHPRKKSQATELISRGSVKDPASP